MIIGASRNPEKFGNKAVRSYKKQGHDVLPINLEARQIEGILCYHDVSEPPGPIDRALLYLPPDLGIHVLEPLAQRGDVAELYINPGAESDALLVRAHALGLNVIQACAIMAIGERP
ncbi:MAG: CoA-binding protein [Phycisphaeraceae bacterium]